MTVRAGRGDSALPFVARQLLAELPCRGVNVGPLLAGVGLDAAALDSPMCRLSVAQYLRLIHRVQDVAKDALLPLHVGLNLNTAAWGECLVRMLACADSHALLALAAKSSPIFAGLLQVDLVTDADEVRLIIGLPHGYSDPAAEEFLTLVFLAAVTRVGRMVVDARFAASRVWLAGSPKAEDFQAQCRRALSCEVIPARTHNAMIFAGPATPIPTADAAIRDWIERRLLGPVPLAAPVDSSVEAAVRSAFARRPVPLPTLAEVAATLHISPRTLRRRLDESGVRFSDLLDQQRKELALRLLRGGAHTLGQVAAMVGFTDHRGLARALRRWTGREPRELLGSEPPEVA